MPEINTVQNANGTQEAPLVNKDAEHGSGDQDTINKGGEPTPEKKDDEQPIVEDYEPKVKPRKTAKDFIIERKQRKIDKLARKNESGDEEEPDEDDLDEEDEKAMGRFFEKNVAPALNPILEKHVQAEDEKEIQTFLTENPDFKPFEKKARTYLAHPSRRNLPIESIFYEVAGPELIKIGAERERAAAAAARESQGGGGSGRDQEGGSVDWSNMSKEEFEKRKLEIRRGK